ncbi:MAG: EAL domain-containing protein [Pseudomonadota bacterium]
MFLLTAIVMSTLVAFTLFAPSIFIKRFETADAEIVADRWLKTLATEATLPGQPKQRRQSSAPLFELAFPNRAHSSPSIQSAFKLSRDSASKGLVELTGYAIYTRFGQRMFSEGNRSGLDVTPAQINTIASDARAQGRSTLRLPFFDRPNTFTIHAPLYKDGELAGLSVFKMEHSQLRASTFSTLQRSASLVAIGLLLITLVFLIILQMISNHRDEAEEANRRLAYHDPLTGLHNRRSLLETLDGWIEHARSQTTGAALVQIDIDNFKELNDLHGHQAGDEMIAAVGQRIQRAFKTELLFRIAGDSFVLLMPVGLSQEDIGKKVDRLIGLFRVPLELNELRITVSVSAGIALAPHHCDRGHNLLRYADLALYRAKRSGRRTYAFYKPDMANEVQRRRYLQDGLQHALHARHLEVHYQPQVELASGRICGFEALLRWPHPIEGYVPASVMVPLAERNGSILEIGEFVLWTACREAALWENDVRIAVNVSPVQLRSGDFSSLVKRVLRDTKLPPERLELEITESVFLENEAHLVRQLHALRRLGVGIALDDFGTGYSSLAYITRVPITKIKIDQSFVSNMPDDPSALAIVEAFVKIGKAIKAEITAEGVETVEQARVLSKAGCTCVQGFLYGAPDPDPLRKTMPVLAMLETVREKLEA